jgi:hypothetical protein
LCDEPIAPPRERLNKSGGISGIIQRLAQPIDRIIQSVVEVYESVLRPESFPQVFPRNHFARLFEQHGENLKWLILEPDSATVLEKFSGAEIDFEWSEARKSR